MIGEDEYETDKTLPDFAADELEPRGLRTTFVMADHDAPNDFAGLDGLDKADLLLVSVRRRFPTAANLQRIRDFLAAGKPLVGIRTACHAFAERQGFNAPSGHVAWQEFGRDVLGCNYTGHHGNDDQPAIHIHSAALDHAILHDFPIRPFKSGGSLYQVSPLAESTTLLLTGQIDSGAEEPVAWTNQSGRSRVFYTSLGHVDDFNQPAFRKLLTEGIFWTLDRQSPPREKQYQAPLAKAP
jgi:type 1 glutamine amidotransferase